MSGKDQIKEISSIVGYVGGKQLKNFNNVRSSSGSLLIYSDVKVTDQQLQEINEKIAPFRGRAIINGSNLEIRVYYFSE